MKMLKVLWMLRAKYVCIFQKVNLQSPCHWEAGMRGVAMALIKVLWGQNHVGLEGP